MSNLTIPNSPAGRRVTAQVEIDNLLVTYADAETTSPEGKREILRLRRYLGTVERVARKTTPAAPVKGK